MNDLPDFQPAPPAKKPRKKRKAKQRPTETISKMALVIELDKIAGRLAELSGCERV